MGDLKKLFAHRDITNTVDSAQMQDIIISTCEGIIDVLSDHCGVNAKNALLIIDKGMDNFNPSIFTKDGIDILNAIEYISPIQSYIKSLLGYIGSRVDSVAHDGTTTSMLLAAIIIKNIYHSHHAKLSEYVIKDLTDILNGLKARVKTIDSITEEYFDNTNEAVSYIAYVQTLITSKGNVELATCMKEIYSKIPKELFPYFSWKRQPMEDNVPFSVYYPKEDAWVDIIVASQVHFNHALGTEFLLEDMDLIVLEEPLLKGYGEVDILLRYLETTTTPTLILYSDIEASILQTISKINDNVPIVLCLYSNSKHGAKTSIELKVLNASAGAVPLHDTIRNDFVIHNVTCHIDRGSLRLSNLYKTTEQGVHIWYTPGVTLEDIVENNGPDGMYKERFNRLFLDIKSHINRLENKHSSDVRKELLIHTQSLRTLIGGRLPILQIGGKTMDIMSNESVVKDALGAITSSLTDGFVIDGNLAMLHLSSKSIIGIAIREVLAIIHGIDAEQLETIMDNYKAYSMADCKDVYLHSNYTHKLLEFSSMDKKYPPVIQPFKLYQELINRLIELIPKLIDTSRIIIPGTANVN